MGPYDKIYQEFLSELPSYEIRTSEKEKQQFIGIQHYKCGVSWKRARAF